MDDDPPLAVTGDPPYTAVIFSSVRLPAAASPDYAEAARRMAELAREQPGYLGLESAAGDGFGITVSYWTGPEAARTWKAVAEHVAVQALGRERWYADYRVRIATVDRDYGPTRARPAAG